MCASAGLGWDEDMVLCCGLDRRDSRMTFYTFPLSNELKQGIFVAFARVRWRLVPFPVLYIHTATPLLRILYNQLVTATDNTKVRIQWNPALILFHFLLEMLQSR